jgi:hypothetical protein
VLESLAHSNYYSPRPRPIDPAVFFDIVKIRRLIDDATSLAVRAANGTTAASLQTSLNTTNGILNGSDAEILGIGTSRGGTNAKLSRERKHRMREHATQKLSHAYKLDEIASSVAMMQSASAIEDVAKHVLHRDEHNPDAQYVHFFHERIPSMQIAQHTNFESLNDILRQRPTEASPHRTKAVLRIFKHDFEGVVRDCTEGLAVHRLYNPQHQNQQRDLVLAKDAAKFDRDSPTDRRLPEHDHPSSLEPQLMFYRGGAHLTLACDNIGQALYGLHGKQPQLNGDKTSDDVNEEDSKAHSEGRRLVRTYAKRALRDYLSFLSYLEYTPGLSAEYTEAFLKTLSSSAFGQGSRTERLLDADGSGQKALSEAVVKYERQKQDLSNDHLPQIPKPAVHKLNELFAAVPPAGLPPYPSEGPSQVDPNHPIFSLPDFSEAITYHPLMMDVLHSVLLCHCLIQTSIKELQRHAYMVARLARVCDGYPVFVAARSPARANWVDLLRKTDNWLDLSGSWDALCSPPPAPGQVAHKETEEQRKARIKKEAMLEALADERVMDEETFAASYRAREMRAAREEEGAASKEYNRTKLIEIPPTSTNGTQIGQHATNRRAREDYQITTDRAEAILRWVQEAPPPSSSGSVRPRKKKTVAGKLRKQGSNASSLRGATCGLEQSVESLDMVD